MVSNNDLAQYRRDGVACIRGLLDASALELLAEAMAENARRPTPRAKTAGTGRGSFYNDYNVWRQSPLFRTFLASTPLAETAAALFGSNSVGLYGDHVLVKSPGSEIRTDWHQDLPYWLVAGEQVGSFWMALQPVTRATGALQFVAGSHLSGTLYNPVGGNVAAKRFAGHADVPADDLLRREHEIICFDLEPGDVTFHHARMLHGAEGNANPDVPRAAYAVRLAGDDAVYRVKDSSREALEAGMEDAQRLHGSAYPQLYPQCELRAERAASALPAA